MYYMVQGWMNFSYAVIQYINYEMKKISGIGIGIGHYGIEYRRYSKQSIGIGIGHHGIVPSLLVTRWNPFNHPIYQLCRFERQLFHGDIHGSVKEPLCVKWKYRFTCSNLNSYSN